MARIRLLPQALARVDPRTGAPRNAVIVQLVFTLVVTFWLALQYDPSTAIGILGALEGLIAMVIFMVINLSCFGFYVRRRGEFKPLLHLVAPLGGVLLFIPAFFTVAGFTVFKFVSPLPAPISYAKVAVAIWMVAGIGYLVYLYRNHPQRLEETKAVFIEEADHDPIADAPRTPLATSTPVPGETLP
jgi:amino acid transporter